MIKKLFFGLCIAFLLINSIFATQIQVNISETAKVTKLLSGSYSLDIKGELEIHNPSNYSKVYEYNLPLKLDSLIGISKVKIDNTSNNFDFTYDRIKGFNLNQNQTFKVGYKIYGIVNYDLLSKLDINESVLEYYSDFEFITKSIINVQKPEREGVRYNDDGTLNNTDGSNTSNRLISAGVRNPGDFELEVKKLDLYSTTADDPMFRSGSLMATFTNISIDPFEYKEVDFFDRYSVNNSVYWMSSNIVIKNQVYTDISRELIIQQPTSSSGGSGGSSGAVSTYNPDEANYEDSLLIKKSVDKTLVNSGDSFKVFLNIVNVEDFAVYNLSIFDEIPEDYEIKNVSKEVKINDNELEFSLNKLDGFSSYTISYTLVNKKQISGITYLKPAKLVFEDFNYFSQGILVINDLLPDKKVFVQKEVSIFDDTYSRVTIKVRNLGSIELNDLLVTDEIPDDLIVKDISQIFSERGSWKINTLLPGEEWSVTYLVEKNPSTDTLPNVFGVEQENVYGTLISSQEVITIFNEKPRTIEKVGLVVSVGLLIFYLLF